MPRINHTKHLAAGAVRCRSCYGHIGRHYYDHGKPCSTCWGEGYVYRPKPEPTRMPADSCKGCGDGVESGKDLCAACVTTPSGMQTPGDNWRASVRLPTIRYRQRR